MIKQHPKKRYWLIADGGIGSYVTVILKERSD